MGKNAGRQAGSVHVYPLRVYYEDTDAGGVVYYANYLRFAERARTEMLRAAGLEPVADMAAHGLAFAVRRCTLDYRRPARLDDRLEVHTRLLAVRGASIEAEQTVKRAGAELVRLEIRLACMDAAGRAARLPKPVRAALIPLGPVAAHTREHS